MVTNETKKICDQAEKALKAIVKKAKAAFDDRIKAMDDISKMPAVVFQLGKTTPGALISGGKGELERDARNFTNEIKSAIKPISDKLESLIKSVVDVEDIVYLVDKLDALAHITEPLNYTVQKYSIAITACHGCVVDEAEKWRDQVDHSPQIRKSILNMQLSFNQKELNRVENELKENEKILAECYEMVEKKIESYNESVSKAMLKVNAKYEELLRAIEVAQKDLLTLSKARIETSESLARASAFSRGKNRERFAAAEKAYQTAVAKLNQLKSDLEHFASSEVVARYDKLDGEIEKMLSQIEEVKGKIQANQTGIQSYKKVIKEIEGELNG